MNATPTAFLTNTNLTSVTNVFQIYFNIFLASAGGTGFILLLYKLLEKLLTKKIDAHFLHQDRTILRKRELAEELLEIISEGKDKAWTEMIGNEYRLVFLVNKASAFDSKVGNRIETFVGLWRFQVLLWNNDKLYQEMVGVNEALPEIVEESYAILIKDLRKWII